MYDTAVKVPTLMSRPGHVPQDLVCDKLLSQYDFMPTILGYTGVENPSDESLPGRDFSPILRGESLGDNSAVFVLDEYGPTRMIRTESWKYVHRYSDGHHELYNLATDPTEAHNLIDDSKYNQKIHDLREELEGWFDRYVDPDMDGSKQKVMGRGQLGLVGSESYPKPFADDIVFFLEEGSH
jgi:arylsulfatase A-like enzyme